MAHAGRKLKYKVLYAWITPSNLKGSVVVGSTKRRYYIDRASSLQDKELERGSSIQFWLKDGVDEISGTLVFRVPTLGVKRID